MTFTTRISGSVIATTGDTIVVFNTGMTDAASFGTVGTRVTQLTSGNLFPFTSPDAVYAGSCTANNPNPNDDPSPPAAAATADVTVIENQTTTASIQLPALDLTSGPATRPARRDRDQQRDGEVTDTECDRRRQPASSGPTYTAPPTGSSAVRADVPTRVCPTASTTSAPTTGHEPPEHDCSGSTARVKTTATDTTATIYLGRARPASRRGPARDPPTPRRRRDGGITIARAARRDGVGIVVLGGVVTLVTTTAKSSDRITERVAVDQIARPMVQRVIDELHSTCVSPGFAPILAGSTGILDHASSTRPARR